MKILLLFLCIGFVLTVDEQLCGPIRHSFSVDIGHLKQVQVMMRHGARTPSGPPCLGSDVQWQCELTHAEKPSFNKDHNLYLKKWLPSREHYRGNCGTGILTTLGYNQQVMNGGYVREMYKDFLPESVNAITFQRDFWVRSTDLPRTFLSAQSFLTGLYPVSNRSEEFYIDIHTMDDSEDDLWTNPNICPRINQYEKEYFESEAYKMHLTNVLNPFAEKVSGIINTTVLGTDIIDLYDCWISEYCNGYGLPEGIDLDILKELEAQFSYVYGGKYQYPTRIKGATVHIGIFLGEFLAGLEKVNDKKLILFSAHDVTLAAMLTVLDNWKNVWPSYANTLITEIYEKNNTKTIRFLYDGQPITVPGCHEFCPLNTLLKLLTPMVATPEDCTVNTHHHSHRVYHPRN